MIAMPEGNRELDDYNVWRQNNAWGWNCTHHDPVFWVDDGDWTFRSLVAAVEHHVTGHTVQQVQVDGVKHATCSRNKFFINHVKSDW